MEPRKPISQADFRRVEEAVDTVVLAPSKVDAKEPLKRLESLARSLEGEMTGYQREKLQEVLAYARAASGSPRDKDHWEQVLKGSLAKLRSAAVTRDD